MRMNPCMFGFVLLNLHRQMYHFPSNIQTYICFSGAQLLPNLLRNITDWAVNCVPRLIIRVSWAQMCNTAGHCQNRCSRDSRTPEQRTQLQRCKNLLSCHILNINAQNLSHRILSTKILLPAAGELFRAQLRGLNPLARVRNRVKC